MQGMTTGGIKGDTRSLDHGSCITGVQGALTLNPEPSRGNICINAVPLCATNHQGVFLSLLGSG